MWNDSTHQEIKRRNFGWCDLSIVKTTDENGFDTFHLVCGCVRQMSGTLSECEAELNKYVRFINKNNKKNARWHD